MDPIQYSGDTLYTEGKTFEFVLAAGGIVHRDAIESNNRLPAFQRNELAPRKRVFPEFIPRGVDGNDGAPIWQEIACRHERHTLHGGAWNVVIGGRRAHRCPPLISNLATHSFLGATCYAMYFLPGFYRAKR